ncbi:hypothetical protein CR194_02370 [Salipaludibacillus keqinensis]|uniref:Uncharacterized protein n=1 Tax=Salipaludibacillus keqinensis TaxID=2045207 RepID=A0A323THT2_9BACI|nr:hypothetical protein [Salipaludibacillus keqinensis]PYZ94398.1 hypothetical protein CR194_02370 [Salipaludibacillus keqinensis]
MHSKQTVRYICKKYLSGNCYYFKQEIIAFDSWEDLDSLYWGAERPITEKTFWMRKKQGYKCKIEKIKQSPALVIPFAKG